VVLVRPFAHSPSRFADDGRRGHDIEAVDLGQIRMRNNSARPVKLRPIPFLLLEPSLPHLLRQTRPWAPIRTLLEILLEAASFRDCSNECLYLDQTLMMDH
jgi:hypothetical protein